jgi:NitT/TauT family transport system permease protein
VSVQESRGEAVVLVQAGRGRPAGTAFRRGLRWAQTPLAFLLALLLWQIVVTQARVPKYVLPPPTDVVDALFRYRERLLRDATITTQEILLGFAVAVLVSVPVALLIVYSPLFTRTVWPMMIFSQIMPKIALAPLFIIWFGFGFIPKVLITFLLSFFPIVIDSVAGFRSLDPEVLYLARSGGASTWDLFWRVRLPAALPHVFAGLKVAAALATTGAIIGEFVGSDRGLGYVLLQANGDLNTALLFAALVVLSTIGLVLYGLVALIEKLLIPWHVSQRVHGGETTI